MIKVIVIFLIILFCCFIRIFFYSKILIIPKLDFRFFWYMFLISIFTFHTYFNWEKALDFKNLTKNDIIFLVLIFLTFFPFLNGFKNSFRKISFDLPFVKFELERDIIKIREQYNKAMSNEMNKDFKEEINKGD